MAVEILAEAGSVAPERMEVAPVARQAVCSQFPLDEAKLVRVIRIEPEEDDRIKILLLARAKTETNVSNEDPPKMSSIVRQALRLVLTS